MKIDEFLELAQKRRSIRRFKPDPVPDEYVEKMLEAARWAMSGANAQPWEFIVVKDEATRKKMANALIEQRTAEYKIEKTRIKELRHPAVLSTSMSSMTLSLREAPVLIVVCGDRRTVMASVLDQNWDTGEGATGAVFYKNMANATQILQLAAAALGLGAQWCSIARGTEAQIRTILGVPELIEIHTVVPVGYAAYRPAIPYRRELKELVHFEKYDKSKYRSTDDIINYIALLRKNTVPSYAKVGRH